VGRRPHLANRADSRVRVRYAESVRSGASSHRPEASRVNASPLSGAQRLRLRENQLFLALSILVGVLAGLGAVLFSLSIDRVSHLLFGLAPSHTRLFLVPPLVSIVTGILLSTVFTGVRGSGVPQTEAAFHLESGVIPGRVP